MHPLIVAMGDHRRQLLDHLIDRHSAHCDHLRTDGARVRGRCPADEDPVIEPSQLQRKKLEADRRGRGSGESKCRVGVACESDQLSQASVEFRIGSGGELGAQRVYRLLVLCRVELKEEVGVQPGKLIGDEIQVLLAARR